MKLILAAFTLLLTHCVFSQRASMNSVYIEAGGPSSIASINYERHLLDSKNIGFTGRIGLGTSRIKDFRETINPDFTVPFGINMQLNLLSVPTQNQIKTRKVLAAEIGAGLILNSLVRADDDFKASRVNQLNTYFTAGLRFDFARGPYFRINYCPIYSSESQWKNWFALGVGYRF